MKNIDQDIGFEAGHKGVKNKRAEAGRAEAAKLRADAAKLIEKAQRLEKLYPLNEDPTITVRRLTRSVTTPLRNNAVLDWLKAEGYNPLNLTYENGWPSVKSVCVNAMLANRELFPNKKSAEKTWERLSRKDAPSIRMHQKL